MNVVVVISAVVVLVVAIMVAVAPGHRYCSSEHIVLQGPATPRTRIGI